MAAGSGIGTIYKEAQKDYDQVRWATNEADSKSLGTLAARIDTRVKEGVPVVVFNSLAWPRSGTVEVAAQFPSGTAETAFVLDEKNQVVPSEVLSTDAATHTVRLLVDARDVPSMGYQVLHVVNTKHSFPSDLKSSGTTLENALLRVVVDAKTGCITSLYDKKAGFETLAAGACGNELQAFKDTPKEYDAWNVDPGTFDVAPTLIHDAESVQMVEVGPLRSIVRVTRTWQASKFVQDLILYAGADHVEVTNDIDWHENHVLLKAAFPLAATSGQATYEIPYGSITRPTTRDNSFEKAKFEVPAMRWADLGDAQHGFSLLNNSKYGYDTVGNLLRLTLLRSATWPDPDADRERHHFTYALYPHAGGWQQALTVRHGYEFNYPLKAMQVAPHAGAMPATHSFAGVAESNVVLTAIKHAEDGNGLIFRLYEWAGKGGVATIAVPPGATGATLTNLMEKPEGASLPVKEGKVTVPVSPFQIQTVQVSYAPSAGK